MATSITFKKEEKTTQPSGSDSERKFLCYMCIDNWSPMSGCSGCLLCKSCGPELGYLSEYARFNNVSIVDSDGSTKVFVPPTYKCLECKDKLKCMYRVHDERERNPAMMMVYDIPYYLGTESVLMACCHCQKEEHWNDQKKAQKEFLSKPYKDELHTPGVSAMPITD
jgi:hypothetical protein